MINRNNHLLLIGMMGSGKTTVGRLLAERLGRPFYDSDAQVELATGMTVPELWKRDGEAAFRKAENDALAAACASKAPAVIAVAGGALLNPANHDVVRGAGKMIWLRANNATLTRRVGTGAGRPLLEGDPKEAIERLAAVRSSVYEEFADEIVEVDSLRPAVIAESIVESFWTRVNVALGERGYDVIVGPGSRTLLDSVLPKDVRRAVVVTQAGIDVDFSLSIPFTVVNIGDGEEAKSLKTIEELSRAFGQFGLTRSDVVIAIGGGVVTDVAGFAASCWHRGTAVVHISTSLLGQVDAAIGGKTGVNIPEGKNLVGAFFQPSAVICDTDLLATLPEREWRSGSGEMAKYAFLGVEDLDQWPLADQVARCAALKAEVVAADERESGRRATLNYGHTLAHALEAIGFAGEGPGKNGVDLRHGEAVAIGLIFAAHLARLLGRIDEARVQRHFEIVRSYGLNEEIPLGVDLEEVVTFMLRDKKSTGGLNFVLDGPNGVEMVKDVDAAVVMEALLLTTAK